MITSDRYKEIKPIIYRTRADTYTDALYEQNIASKVFEQISNMKETLLPYPAEYIDDRVIHIIIRILYNVITVICERFVTSIFDDNNIFYCTFATDNLQHVFVVLIAVTRVV